MFKPHSIFTPIAAGIVLGAAIGVAHSCMDPNSGRKIKRSAEHAVRSMSDIANELAGMISH